MLSTVAAAVSCSTTKVRTETHSDINGSITSVLVIPSSVSTDNEGTEESKEEPLVLASSLDRLIYLLDLGTPRGTQRSRGKTLYSYFTGLENVTSMVLLSKPVDEAAQDDDTFWGGMTVVGDNVQAQESEDEEPEKAPKRRRS